MYLSARTKKGRGRKPFWGKSCYGLSTGKEKEKKGEAACQRKGKDGERERSALCFINAVKKEREIEIDLWGPLDHLASLARKGEEAHPCVGSKKQDEQNGTGVLGPFPRRGDVSGLSEKGRDTFLAHP